MNPWSLDPTEARRAAAFARILEHILQAHHDRNWQAERNLARLLRDILAHAARNQAPN